MINISKDLVRYGPETKVKRVEKNLISPSKRYFHTLPDGKTMGNICNCPGFSSGIKQEK